MKKKLSLLLALTGAAVLFAGCSTVQTADVKTFNNQSITASGTSVAHVSGYTSGLYLLWIPLLTGSTANPGSIDVLKDTVTVGSLMPVLTAETKKLGATKVLNLASQFKVGGFIFYTRQINISGNAVQ